MQVCRHTTCRRMHLRLQALLRPSQGGRQAVRQRRGASCGDAAGHLLQQGQLGWQHSFGSRACAEVDPAWCASFACDGVQGSGVEPGPATLCCSDAVSHGQHQSSSVCLQYMSSQRLWLLVSPEPAGPKLTGARCTAVHGTSAGMSRVNQHNRQCVPLHMQEQQPRPIDAGRDACREASAQMQAGSMPRQPCCQVRAHQWARAAPPATLLALQAAGQTALHNQPQGRCRPLQPHSPEGWDG